ncbi:MAG: hypothetical protein Q4F85_16935 [Prevotella sp.]|nr:hypothetical protein [Prevotella sp.]
MKKIFTLIAAMMLFVGGAPLNAQNEVDIPLDNWGWGFNCESSFADGVLTGTLTGGYGAVSTGWNDGVDWSAYNKLTVVIESYSNDWGKVYFSDVNGKSVAEVSFSTITKSTAVNLVFDGVSAESLKAVKQLAVQGKATGDVIKISRVYLTEAVAYETEGKEIAFDEWGNILASEFEGYSDNAKVVFTYITTGELTNAEGSSIVGWGTGSITSIDGTVKVADVPVKDLGDNEISFLLSDLKEALAAGPSQYGQYGLNWNMYPQGNSTSTRKSVIIYKSLANPDVPEPSVAIWEGNADFGIDWAWDNTIGLAGSAFSKVKSGESLVFEIKTNADADKSELKILFGQWGNQEHRFPSALAGVAKEEYDTFGIEAGSTTYVLPLTDEDIATLKSEGLRISGFNMTVTKITSSVVDGINAIEAAKPVQNNMMYNLAGQKVGAGYKGIVIKNGKKVIVK